MKRYLLIYEIVQWPLSQVTVSLYGASHSMTIDIDIGHCILQIDTYNRHNDNPQAFILRQNTTNTIELTLDHRQLRTGASKAIIALPSPVAFCVTS